MAAVQQQPALSSLMDLMKQKQAAVIALASRRAAATSGSDQHLKRKSMDQADSVSVADVFGLQGLADPAQATAGAPLHNLYATAQPAAGVIPSTPMGRAVSETIQEPAPTRRKAGRKPGPRAPAMSSEAEEDDEKKPKGKNGKAPPMSDKKRREQNRAAQKAWRERKEKHLKDLEEKVRLYESQDNSLAPLFQQNQELRALVESLKEENDRLRQAAFTFVAPPSLPGTSSNSFESFAHPTVQEDIFAVPHAHKSPASDNDTGYSSGHAGSPSHSSESFEETGPGLSALESQGSLQLVDVLKDMDAADARQLLMNLLAQQQEQLQLPATTVAPLSATPGAAVAMAQLPPFAPISISPPTTEEQELIDGVLESASNAGYFNAPSWDAFDPQLVDLMSVILPQGTEDYNTLAGFLPADQTLLPEPSAFSPSSMLAPQAPLGIGIPDADVALFGGDSVAVDAMDWQHLVEPTRKPYMETLPMLTQAIRAPELRLPESAVKILRTLDMSKVPCKVLRVKLERLAEKYRHSDVACISDAEFTVMMRKRISAMAKAMGKSRLSPEEESVLVDMMMSKATVECHAEQLAGALHDIKEIADNPSGSVDMKRLERVKAAFSTCPNGDHDD